MWKCINTVYGTSVTKDSTVAAKAGKKYKMAFQCVQWAFSILTDVFLVFLSLYFEYDFHDQ